MRRAWRSSNRAAVAALSVSLVAGAMAACSPTVDDATSDGGVAARADDDPSIECPDLCEADCSGQPLPEVPDGCPVLACDCTALEPTATALEAVAVGDVPRCATPTPDADTIAAVEAALASRADSLPGDTTSKHTIPVVFHVIRRRQSDGQLVGDVPRKRLIRQLDVMNQAFARTVYNFTLRRITRTTNRSWFRMEIGSTAEHDAKQALHQGGAGTLNVYLTGTRSALGWSTFPWANAGNQDGIVLNDGTLPGGFQDHYDLGDTLVHEIGHWLGLYHTFEGGCGGGDLVGDTPHESSPAFGCPVGRDSCPRKTGDDPIHNFMDYTDDACIDHFSRGQRQRMGLFKSDR